MIMLSFSFLSFFYFFYFINGLPILGFYVFCGAQFDPKKDFKTILIFICCTQWSIYFLTAQNI